MWIIVLCCCACQIPVADDPPVAGRPSGFSGAIGDFRYFSTSASPTELPAGESIWFKVSVTCLGDAKGAPSEPELEKLREFTRHFVISKLMTSTEASGLPTNRSTWEFNYELRPVDASVTEIPALRFDYYRPGIVPPEKGYQTRYSDPIPLKVHPRRAVESGDVAGVTVQSFPESIHRLSEGVDVLRQGDLPLARDPTAESLLSRAESAFRTGSADESNPTKARTHFASAAADYAALRQRGYRSVALLRNLGNAYLLAGDLPNAILAYRQALQVESSDRETRANLDYVRSQVIPPPTHERNRNTVVPILRLVTIAGLVAAIVLIVAGWLRRRAWHYRVAAALAVCAAASATGFMMADRRQRLDDRIPFTVATTDDIQLRTGDGELYPVRADRKLNRGAEARLLFVGDRWIQIEMADGVVGWIPRNAVLLSSS